MLKSTVRVRRPYVPDYCPNDATTYYDYSVIGTCRPLLLDETKKLARKLRADGLTVVGTFITTLR